MAQDTRALTYSYDFQPGGTFDVAGKLETSQTVKMLQTVSGDTVSEISQPDEYGGYVIRYDVGEATVPAFLFVRDDSLSVGDSETMGDSASVFSPRLNLMRTTLE